MLGTNARDRLRELLRRRAVMHGEFVLSSGQRSSYYLDARLVTLSADGAALVGETFLEALEGVAVDAVAGLTVGADPIVCAIAAVAGMQGRAIDGLIVRKERKGHGAGRRIEGPWRDGMRVAVVDDTFTTGASGLDAATAVREAGGRVEAVYALIDREEGAREAIEAAGYRFEAVFRAAELVDIREP
ncbi:MAG: orotate phosphoribosyltransferase [Chloroflexi bacterium]|nr:orotate phosphoribosyltransferase [Chloroflexota bacterium]